MQTIQEHSHNVCQRTADISGAYHFRMQSLQLQMRDVQSSQRALLFVLAVLLLGAVIALCQPWHFAAIVPFTIATLLLRRLFFLRKDLAVYSRLDEWYNRGIDRVDEKW